MREREEVVVVLAGVKLVIIFWFVYYYRMFRRHPLIVWSIVIVFVLGGIAGAAVWYSSQPGELDTFAQCLGEEGATFYGAFWCPHCDNQKAMFGRSQDELPYHECSTPDGQGQLQECTDIGIQSYPTWIFADESRLTGEVSLQRLAEKTGCELPN